MIHEKSKLLACNGEPVGIIMTPNRYDAMLETIEVLADKEVIAALNKSAADFKAGRVYAMDWKWLNSPSASIARRLLSHGTKR